jgi:hypothetical protein
MVLLFCLTGYFDMMAQTVPWLAPAASLNAVDLRMNCIPMVDGQRLNEGDYIGVFNDGGRCFGLARWKDTLVFNITVYGSDGSTDGFNSGEKLNLKVWLRNENCTLEKIAQVAADNPLVFSNTTVNRINVLNFQRLSVSFEKESYCRNEGILVPDMNYPVNDLSFAASHNLSVDPVSGTIDPLKNLPGSYTVSVISRFCMSGNSLALTLLDFPRPAPLPDTLMCGDSPLRLSLHDAYAAVNWSTGANASYADVTEPGMIWYRVTDQAGCSNADTVMVKKTSLKRLEYTVDKADCHHEGRIAIGNSEVENGRPPFSYRVKSQLEDKELTDLYEVPEGIYNIEVVNVNGCILRQAEKVIVEKDCLNDIPVISPNDDGLDDRYFIALEGPVRIFDRTGSLKRRLTGPCYFDGNDENGKPLPMGVYMIITEKQEKVELTIVR